MPLPSSPPDLAAANARLRDALTQLQLEGDHLCEDLRRDTQRRTKNEYASTQLISGERHDAELKTPAHVAAVVAPTVMPFEAPAFSDRKTPGEASVQQQAVHARYSDNPGEMESIRALRWWERLRKLWPF
jgi:hypothetical protein